MRWGEEEEPSRGGAGEVGLTGLSPGPARRRSRGGLRRPKTIELPDFDSNEESEGSADEGGGARGALLPPIGWRSMPNAGR